MKTAVRITRILLCVTVSFYTVYLGIHVGRSAYLKGQEMQINPDGAFELVWKGINGEVMLYIAVGLLILLSGIASAFLVFKNRCIFAVVASVCAAACALLGISLNTELSEYMFMRYQLGVPRIPVEIALAVKPLLALLCICAAVCYTVLFWIDYQKTYRKENR